MISIRHGLGILALAFAVGTAGACSANRAEPDWRPRTSRGSVYGPTKTKAKAGRNDRRGSRNRDDGVRRGQGKKKNDNPGNNGRNNRNRGNGKKKGHG